MENNHIIMPAEVRDYFAAHQVITLATHGPQGLWAAAVFYVHHNWHLYFLSAGHTRHAQNIAANPRVAGTIQENYQEWTLIQGIQCAGVVTMLLGAERKEAISRFQ